MRILFLLFTVCITLSSYAGKITGTVTNEKGEPLPYSSLNIKGSKEGTSANSLGVYFFQLSAGTYTIICRHVGYERQEKTITVSNEDVQLNFVLKEQTVSLSEVVVKAGAEDPAYAIIRKAIKKRKEYVNENDSYSCEVYSKGTMNLRDYPKKFMGEKVDFEDGDTSKKKMIYLSETVSKLSVDKPNKIKIDVLSTRVSGQSDGFGFAGARFFSFYENNVQISNSLNPRGFVSPIAENAMHFYKYKYEGAFSEEGKLISKIKVTPKRLYEPCFSGYINIVEDEWRIHSLELSITKQNQMNFADTVRIEQLYRQMGTNFWVMQSQLLYPAVKFFGFDAYGSFANVYRNYNTEPAFDKKYFGNTILKYEKGSNKKSINYWDSIRPLALTKDEQKDYVKKDSLEQLRKDPAYLDSLDRISNKVKFNHILLSGKTFNKQSKKLSIGLPGLLSAASFNTVEGLVLDVPVTIRKEFTDRKNLTVIPHFRYGFSNERFNAWATARYNFGNKFLSSVSIGGGKRVFQLNNENPIEPLSNTIATLFYKNNFMKLYAADYARINFSKGIGGGVTINAALQYQNRQPLKNTTEYNWANKSTKQYNPNYPVELMSQNFDAHQAAVITLGISVQPGARYIEFPDRVVNVGNKWPVFNLQYSKGLKNVFKSDVDYDKWQFTVRDNLNLKMIGRFNYRAQTGGFLNRNAVFVQDLKHFPGNRLFRATDFMTTFQLPQYYQYSNADKMYAAVFTEHHFNGFITNKIPGLKQLNWHLVSGVSSLWLPKHTYAEWHVGLENIFRFFRVDVVTGYQQTMRPRMELRIGTTINVGGNSTD
ncbi:DUF5686 and carboxypeptidase regulatory-like domain-containing protein [Lacibacter sp. H375]|uniref:DUF5686 and carboxypeptidase regulatory-like domain-containing protein n=1 Tax=Lacibacter sp. H375 TaxID=3133424 RepID=UPI0030C4817A